MYLAPRHFIEDTILHSLLQTGLPLYMVIQTMQRSSRLKGQYSSFLSYFNLLDPKIKVRILICYP